jgi:hypothetical protein
MIDAMASLHTRLREGKWADLGNGVGTYGPFLALVPPEKLAVLTIHEAVNAVVKAGNAGVPLTTLLMNVAEAVRTEVCVGGGGRGRWGMRGFVCFACAGRGVWDGERVWEREIGGMGGFVCFACGNRGVGDWERNWVW